MAPHTERDLAVTPMMNKAQVDIAYALVGVRRADPDYYAAWVMNNALGQYALGGRLGDSIREKQGMAYYVYSSLDASLAEGPLMIRAGVSGKDVERTLSSIDQEIAHVRRRRSHRERDRRVEALSDWLHPAAARDELRHCRDFC